ncbi:retrovirus-related Pol polyprotein from transposon 17.6 [Trichonephila clavipes]|nr:retrovirus-related Pol polyprotein from transposon 17.6 [Trichonephila clavipes]
MLSIKIISDESTPYDHILKEYQTLTRPAGTLRYVSHSTVHHIRTTPGPPVLCRPRRIAPERIKIAKAGFEALVLEVTARRGDGSWASPLHLVPKTSEGKTSVTFLGYQVYSEGTRPLPDHIADLQNFPVPKAARDLRRFLGMVNFYRRCLPSAAKYQSSLNDALSGLRGAQPVTWTSELDTAFSKCKEALSKVTLLTHPAPDVPLGLFYGCFCSPRWNNTDATCRCAVQHFRHVLEAQHCTIYTYHKPVTYAFLQRRQKLPPVQLNQLSFIGQFTTDIQHISGAKNVVADAFFRISYIAPPPVDLKAIAEAQKGDTELLHLQTTL